jgi:HEAT repeat protein
MPETRARGTGHQILLLVLITVVAVHTAFYTEDSHATTQTRLTLCVSVPSCVSTLQDNGEHAMVRHEAAEALGAIADDSCIKLLKDYSACEEPIVADSCIVALDMIAHERSGAFEYADLGES